MVFSVPKVESIIEQSSVLRVPLLTPFRGVAARLVMIFRGTERVGEWAAFPEYSDEIAALWLAMALEQAYDPRFSGLRTAPAGPVPVNATIPEVPVTDIPHWWGKFPGAKSAKIKILGRSRALEEDIRRIEAVADTAGSDVPLRLDANGHLTVDQTLELVSRLSHLWIDYLEQPVSSLSEMAELRTRLKGSRVRLAADELIRPQNGLKKVIAAGAADVAVLKVSPLGGLESARELALQANGAGLEVVISSGLETSVGLSWGIRAADLLRRDLGSLADAGLGTAVFFRDDVVVDPLLVSEGSVPINEPQLDEIKVERWAAPPTVGGWWRERLKRCFPLALSILESRDS